MVQKIETGGTSSTRTPMLKFRMKFALCDKEARHMTHCASVESEKSKTHSAAIIPSLKVRSTFIKLVKPPRMNLLSFQPGAGRFALAAPTRCGLPARGPRPGYLFRPFGTWRRAI